MNGQMYQICCLVAAAKMALQQNKEIVYQPMKYENKTEFQFLPEKRLFKKKIHYAKDVTEWFNFCLKKGLEDIKCLAPIAVENRNLLGFSNATESAILCFYKNGNVTYFLANWQVDSVLKVWNISYSEYEWTNPPSSTQHFQNNLESFHAVLSDIKELASKIDCDYFANVFQKAIDILSGSHCYPDIEYNLPLPQIPEKNMALFEAASTADVFGAMGSWNDSPPFLAQEKGLAKEYETLSAELLKQMRLAMLYSINEW